MATLRRAGVGAVGAVARTGGRAVGDEARRQIASELLEYPLWRLPGHYYSPLPDLGVACSAAARAASSDEDPVGVELRETEQMALLEALVPLYGDVEFPIAPTPGWRFHHHNSQFPFADAILLHLLVRYWRPARVVEIGSGFSTAVIADTVERCAGPELSMVSIEPYPDRLRSVLGTFPEWFSLLEARVQDVPLETFDQLASGDILFIDSTHVARTGSDVVYELFDVLPRLASGVRVHFHDICWPFEYPISWVEQGRAWNEVYAVRALLTSNDAFEITLFNHMMLTKHRDWFARHMPRCLAVRGDDTTDVPGHGLWLVKR